MPQKQKPPIKGRPLWISFDGASTDQTSLFAYQSQHLIGSHLVRPALAATVASLAFGGPHVG